MAQKIKIFSGSSHPELAKDICKRLKLPLSKVQISKFACGEIYARPEESVRGCNVYVIQSTTHNVNEDLMELFIMLDAMKRSFAKKVHVVMPFYAYSRQDRVSLPREPISAKLVADLISTAGADHVITMNLHADQEQGFFNYGVDNLSTRKLFVNYLKKKKIKNPVIVSPDAGGVKEAKKLADDLGADLAMIHKTRTKHNESQIVNIVGDVEGRTCILYDDMVDTAGSVCNAKKALEKFGAGKDIYLAATHPVFSGPAIERLSGAGFKEVIVTNSIPLPKEKQFKGLSIIKIDDLLAKIITNVHTSKSLTSVTK